MKKYKIGFQRQWDKLKPDKFIAGASFTTYRAYIPWLDKNYQQMRKDNAEAVILLNKQPIGTAKQKYDPTYEWSDKVSLDFIKKDTHKEWGWLEWQKQIEKMYGNYPVFGVMLHLEVLTDKINIKKQTKIF